MGIGGGMKKRTAGDNSLGEEPSLTQTATPALYGTIILIDIDNMEEIMKRRGWNQYSPNQATGLLSNLIEDLARKWQAVIVYGLDWTRGTEEAILEIPGIDPEDLTDDLIRIIDKLCYEAKVTATIVVVRGPVTGVTSASQRRAYEGYRRRAKRILEKLKRKGGGLLYVNGSIVYISPCQQTLP